MKKIKFGAQLFILIAAFPVLFITGINRPSMKGEKDVNAISSSASVIKSTGKENCICKISGDKNKITTVEVLTLMLLRKSS